MFRHLGHFAYRRRWSIVVLWAVVLAVSLPIAPRLGSVLKTGGFASENLEALRASSLLEDRLGQYSSGIVAVFRSDRLTSSEPAFSHAVEEALRAVSGVTGVVQVVSPYDNPRQVSANGHTAFAIVAIDTPREQSRATVREVQNRLHAEDLDVLLSGVPVFYADIEDVSESDLRRAEMIALPLGLVALFLVLRSAVAALVPIAVGGAGVVAALAGLFLLGQGLDLSIFVLNMATMLGLGLSIDYALFLTYRFREELSRCPPEEALAVTVATSGRAVFFSALTVLTGLLGLTTFDSMMLRSLGIGGIVVVGWAALAALTLLPALLALLGPRVNSLRLPALPFRAGFSWARLAGLVMRRPVAVLIPVLAVLLILGWPFLRVRLSSPDATILPPQMASRQGFELLRNEFGEGTVAPVEIVVTGKGSILTPANISKLYDFTHDLANDPRVGRIESIVDIDPRISKEQYLLTYADPKQVSDPYARAISAALLKDDTTLVRVAGKYPMISPEAQSLVHDIRQKAPGTGFDVLVGGSSATIVDHVDNLYSELPRAALIVVAVTYLALFLLFRSIILPLKAILMNSLSLLASYGALVVVFQEGFLSRLLSFEPTGFVEASLPIVMFCFLFGVSMDYEVFLLSRIKEAYDRTCDNPQSVAEGLERSGRIITAAALIVVVVGGSFVAADIVLVKALGLGTALAVFLDATIVRALLAPATMRLLGGLNWWTPKLRWPQARVLRKSAAILAIAALAPAGVMVWNGYLQSTLARLGLEVRVGLESHSANQDSQETLSSENLLGLRDRVGREISLPADDAAHDNLTEWWYYTGHLIAEDGGAYGFQLVVFQSLRQGAPAGYVAHFAVTDRQPGTFRFDQRSVTAAQPQNDGQFEVRVGDWTIAGGNGKDHLAAQMDGYGLSLFVESTRDAALHGANGIVSFGPAGDSYYYSRTRMAAEGTLAVGGVAKPVRGSVWMDHQWGDFLVLSGGGWDWLGLQLDDGTDLAVSRVRDRSGNTALLYGTLVDSSGHSSHIAGGDLRLTGNASWTSPASGIRYPAGWLIGIDSQRLSLEITPVVANQELDTRKTTGVVYWEGQSAVSGWRDGRPISGLGYVELTGYKRITGDGTQRLSP